MGLVEEYRVLVTGSRKWTNRQIIRNEFRLLRDFAYGDVVIIHGGAEGADTIAEEEAPDFGFTTRVFLPRYDEYPSNVAPLMRNIEMLDEKPHEVLGFKKGRSKRSGTTHCINQAAKRGIPTKVKYD